MFILNFLYCIFDKIKVDNTNIYIAIIKIWKYLSTFVYSNIDIVWNFYTDIQHLKIITPQNRNLKIIKTTKLTIMEGQEAIIEEK